MFVTLSVEPVACPRRKARRLLPSVSVRQVRLPGAVSFYHMTAQTPHGELPWDVVAEAAGKLRTQVLCPQGVTPHMDSGVRQFAPLALPQLLLFNMGLAVLRERKLSPGETPVTVIDPAAVLAQRIDLAAPFAASLRVLTARPERFAAAQRLLLAQYGLSLCVGAPDAPAPLHGVLFSLCAARAPRLFDGLLFTREDRTLLYAETVVGEGVLLPPALEAVRPDGIDRTQFAAALFERCGVEELGNLSFQVKAAGSHYKTENSVSASSARR